MDLYWANVITFSVIFYSFVLNVASTSPRTGNIPSLITRGTHYEIGFAMGRTFRKYIHQYYEEHSDLHSVWVPWSKTPQGQEILEDFLVAAKASFPQYVRELKGMADGANVPFNEMFLVNLGTELSVLVSNRKRHTTDSCTDLLVNHPEENTILLGHNEDNTPLIQNKAYIVTATITENDKTLEQFMVYCYPGVLPGNAFGFNSHGVITTVNGLYPNFVLKGKVGRSFINRAMLASHGPQDAVTRAKTPATYGFSCNIGYVGNSQPQLYNIEVVPDSHTQDTLVNVLEVLPPGGKPHFSAQHNTSLGYYFHVNMYRRFVVDQVPGRIVSSRHRTLRIKEYSEPGSSDDVKTILSDTKDNKYPIYRSPRSTDNETTLATALFDLQRCVLSVYLDRPSTSLGPEFTEKLPCQSSQHCELSDQNGTRGCMPKA